MKKTFNFIKNLLLFMYIFLIIFVTICLLSFNDYKVTEFGKSTMLPVVDDDLKPNFNKGDLLIINKVKLDDLKNDDIVFFYRTRSGETTVNFGRVVDLERVTDTETTITIEGNIKFSSSNLIGTANSTTVIQNVGYILSLLESKWGFLALGVFPSLIVFLYTLYSVVLEFYLVKKSPQKNGEEKVEEKAEVKDSNEEDEKIKALEEKLNKLKEAKKEKEETEKEDKEDEKTKKIRELEEKIKNIESADEDTSNDEEEKSTDEEEQVNVEEELNKIKEDIKPKKIEPAPEEPKEEIDPEEEKKKKIEEKMKSLTDEQKRALIEAKLKSMTPEQKRALIEAKRKKMEEKNGD